MNTSAPLSRRTLLAATALGPALMTLAQAQAQGVAPKRGGTLNTVLTPEPPVLILGVNSQGPTLVCASKIYQGLVKYPPRPRHLRQDQGSDGA